MSVSAAERAVGTLQSLGITRTEAGAYLELLQGGPGTGYDLARRTGIARANTYSALEELSRQGLVKRTGTAPASFAALPPVAVVGRLAAGFAESLDRLDEALRAIEERRPASPPMLERFDGSAAARAAVERLAARADSRVAIRLPEETIHSFDAVARGLNRRGIVLDVAPSPTLLTGCMLIDRSWAAVWRLGGLGLWGNEPLLIEIAEQLLGVASPS